MKETCTEAEALDDMADYDDEDMFDEDMFDEDEEFERLIEQQMFEGRQILEGKIRQRRKERYKESKQAKVGATIQCAFCATLFKKRSYQQAFCSNKGKRNCKDLYWNMVDPNRMDYIVNKR